MEAVKSIVKINTSFSKILSLFPNNFSFSFAYGSGVFKQSGFNASQSNMIDLIFVVEDSAQWHRENISKNPSHYSWLKMLGHDFIANFQDKWGARVYFNTLVPFESILLKYGVISRIALEADLLDWNFLYLAGRLHKPVEILHQPTISHLRSTLHQNLFSAAHTALLILPETFTETDFYRTIASLSYVGDFRMKFGEDKNKVVNIVAPQVDAFSSLYAPIVKSLHDYVHFPSDSVICSQDVSPNARMYHLYQLPKTPQKAVVQLWNRGPRKLRQDTEDSLRAVAHDPECRTIVKDCIGNIVWNSSISQSLKGILTAGLFKSIIYSGRKVRKMVKSK